MCSLKDVLESTGMPVQRGVYTGKPKPKAYLTFIRLSQSPALNADDEESSSKELYQITLICKGDFEEKLKKTKEVMKAAGYYINGVDTEHYEQETGYWIVPITMEILKD